MSILTQKPVLDALAILLVALLTKIFFALVLKKLVIKTKTEKDDELIKILSNPMALSVLLVGTYWLYNKYSITTLDEKTFLNIVAEIVLILWTSAGFKLSNLFFGKKALAFVRAIVKVGFVINLFAISLIIWGIDITPLLTSAGLLGVGITIAAKDSISNLIGGISVFIEDPYKIGDYVVIKDKYRGEVIEIGIRSTKIRTRDDLLITVPNSLMVTDGVVNETGFDSKLRVRIPVRVSYDSPLEKVEELLVSTLRSNEFTIDTPSPRVRYRKFGESAIELEAMAVILNPENRGKAMHTLIKEIDAAFKKAGIPMPYPQQDINITAYKEKGQA